MKTLVNLDNCLPDYFSGHSNRVLVAYYDKNTTIKDILEQIESDANNQDIDGEFCGFSWCEFKRALKQSKLDNKDIMENPYMPDCDFEFCDNDKNQDWDNYPVAFFTIEGE